MSGADARQDAHMMRNPACQFTRAREDFLRPLNRRAQGPRRNGMRAFYAVLFGLFMLAMSALEVASSRATARIAEEPDPPFVSVSPPLPGR